MSQDGWYKRKKNERIPIFSLETSFSRKSSLKIYRRKNIDRHWQWQSCLRVVGYSVVKKDLERGNRRENGKIRVRYSRVTFTTIKKRLRRRKDSKG